MKKVLNLFFVLLFIFLINVSSVNGMSPEFKNVMTSKGKYATYYQSAEEVLIPKDYQEKEREFRGAWVSAFAGDITGFVTSEEAFRSELLGVLDILSAKHFNAIVFHLRTHNDALYKTKLAPKSEYIENADFTKWDYLPWFINECHKRGIEFHAWLNPYRLKTSTKSPQEIANEYFGYPLNPAYKKENILKGSGNEVILNPGEPDVRSYLVDVCLELIENYKIDAIHFDDYFYIQGAKDDEIYRKYKKNDSESRADFRRRQVDLFIEELSKAIKDYNIEHHRFVQLGISPSAVYRNIENNHYIEEEEYKYEDGTLISPLASNSQGYAHYDEPLYSDVKKWIDNEWIDYVIPQLYGSFESASCYPDLVDWWSHVVKYKKVNLYIGIGLYQADAKSDSGWMSSKTRTFASSLLYNQKHPEVEGFCVYQYKSIINNLLKNEDVKNVLTDFIKHCVLNPVLKRYKKDDMPVVPEFPIYKGEGNYTLLIPKEDVARYVVYKKINDEEILLKSGTYSSLTPFTTFIDTGTDATSYGIAYLSGNNERSDITWCSCEDALSMPDIPFAKAGTIKIKDKVEYGRYVPLYMEKGELYAGSALSYEMYFSLDGENFVKINRIGEADEGFSVNSIRFDNHLKPIYVKGIIKNEYGEMETDVLVIDFAKKDILHESLKYVSLKQKEMILKLTGDDEDA